MTAELTPQLVPRLGPAVGDYPPGATFGPRDAASFELVWIVSGGARWNCGAAERRLWPGCLLLVRPGMRDVFRWDSQVPTRHGYVHFTLPDAGGERDWALVREPGGPDDPMGGLCRYLLWLGTARPPAWQRRAADVLALLLAVFAEGPLPQYDGGQLPAPVAAMMAYVDERWAADGRARPLALAELAAAAAVSQSTLCRIFRRQFPVGPVAALELLRLARAEPLLWSTDLTVQAIAAQCGFADAYHFSRRFRAAYGVSPSGFRAAGPTGAPPSPVARAGLHVLTPPGRA